ncbi:hypothetical protein SLNHY_0128 [Streptomyces albus]|nr:hypothetical protein SLNHY_0128 [Streptomyces albus]
MSTDNGVLGPYANFDGLPPCISGSSTYRASTRTATWPRATTSRSAAVG